MAAPKSLGGPQGRAVGGADGADTLSSRQRASMGQGLNRPDFDAGRLTDAQAPGGSNLREAFCGLQQVLLQDELRDPSADGQVQAAERMRDLARARLHLAGGVAAGAVGVAALSFAAFASPPVTRA